MILPSSSYSSFSLPIFLCSCPLCLTYISGHFADQWYFLSQLKQWYSPLMFAFFWCFPCLGSGQRIRLSVIFLKYFCSYFFSAIFYIVIKQLHWYWGVLWIYTQSRNIFFPLVPSSVCCTSYYLSWLGTYMLGIFLFPLCYPRSSVISKQFPQ